MGVRGLIAVLLMLPASLMAQEAEGEQRFADMLSMESTLPSKSSDLAFGSCDGAKAEDLAASAAGTVSQYIYNAYYVWAPAEHRGERCVVMLRPFLRVLTAQEAASLHSASNQEFPESPKRANAVRNLEPPHGPGTTTRRNPADVLRLKPPQEQESEEKSDEEKEPPPGGSGSGGGSYTLPMFYDTSYPYDGLTFVQTGSQGTTELGGSSAVQLTPYVYATAAHVLQERQGSPKINVRIFPRYNLPNTTTAIPPVASIPHPDYASQSSDHRAVFYDIGFIKSAIPMHRPRYLPLWSLNDTYPLLSGREVIPVPIGNFYYDVYYISSMWHSQYHSCINSWRWRYPINSPPYCPGYPSAQTYTQISMAGYPLYNGSYDNRTTHYPYHSGGPTQGFPVDYGLFYPDQYSKPVIGVQAPVSDGMSGGPIIATLTTNPPTNPVTPRASTSWLMGIIGVGSPDHPLGPYTGGAYHGGRTRSFWDQHVGWEPYFDIEPVGGTHQYRQVISHLDIVVRSPGVPQVDIYQQLQRGGPSGATYPMQLIAIAGDGETVRTQVGPDPNNSNFYYYYMFPRGNQNLLLAEVRVEIEWARLD